VSPSTATPRATSRTSTKPHTTKRPVFHTTAPSITVIEQPPVTTVLEQPPAVTITETPPTTYEPPPTTDQPQTAQTPQTQAPQTQAPATASDQAPTEGPMMATPLPGGGYRFFRSYHYPNGTTAYVPAN
jgi:hypothetical protein